MRSECTRMAEREKLAVTVNSLVCAEMVAANTRTNKSADNFILLFISHLLHIAFANNESVGRPSVGAPLRKCTT